MTIVVIKDAIMMIEGVKKRAVHFDFHWKTGLTLKNYFGSRAGTTQAASIEIKLVGVALFGARPDWKPSTKGRL